MKNSRLGFLYGVFGVNFEIASHFFVNCVIYLFIYLFIYIHQKKNKNKIKNRFLRFVIIVCHVLKSIGESEEFNWLFRCSVT